MLIAIFVLIGVLVMLIFSRPVAKFNIIHWMLMATIFVLIIFCSREFYLSYFY